MNAVNYVGNSHKCFLNNHEWGKWNGAKKGTHNWFWVRECKICNALEAQYEKPDNSEVSKR